jgi:putative restriction endonuclease
MDLSTDEELRAIAFARMQELRGQYGDRIPAAELSAGVTFHGDRVPIWNYQKGIFKPALLGKDGAALSIQTSADSPYEDERDSDAGHFIYKYRGTDPAHPDNRALRTAMELRRPLLYFVAVDPGFYSAVFPVFITDDQPNKTQVKLVADQPSVGLHFVESPMADVGRAYATRAVMQRLHQQHFRRIVLAAYRDRCSICRLNYLELLDAAHILGDKDPKGEPIVSNGLGMCKIHHSAFDANILGIDPDAKVHIRVDVLKRKDGPMLKHGLQALHGVSLGLPTKISSRPNREFLEQRFARFLAG